MNNNFIFFILFPFNFLLASCNFPNSSKNYELHKLQDKYDVSCENFIKEGEGYKIIKKFNKNTTCNKKDDPNKEINVISDMLNKDNFKFAYNSNKDVIVYFVGKCYKTNEFKNETYISGSFYEIKNSSDLDVEEYSSSFDENLLTALLNAEVTSTKCGEFSTERLRINDKK